MRRTQASKYARWSAAVAVLLAVFTSAAYMERKWAAIVEKEKAPPPAPKDVTRLLNGISFSKMMGNQKIFSVDASRSTDYKDRDASLLEDVKITIFGKTGARRDVIHTQSCQYEKTGGAIACSGEVQFDLQSAVDAERESRRSESRAAQKIHAETRGVLFNRATGTVSSDQPIQFVFPSGSGQAVGVEYRSEAGEMHLLKDVRLLLTPPESDGAAPQRSTGVKLREPVHVWGKSLDFGRDTRTMRLHGPVKAESSQSQLLAGELTLTLDSAFRIEKIVATGGTSEKPPELLSHDKDSAMNLSAVRLTAHFAPQGWLTTLEGEGRVQGSRRGGKESQDLNADSISIDLLPRANQPKQAVLRGNVELRTRASNPGEERALQTEALFLEFAEPSKGEGTRPKRAETVGPGSIEWVDAPPGAAQGSVAATAQTRTELQADKLEMGFGQEGKPKELDAAGNVHLEKTAPGRPTQTATGQNGKVQMLADGSWSQMDLQGAVNLKEDTRSGQADHAVFLRVAQTAMLIGKAVARDATTETRAPRITFVQASGDTQAEGGVRSTAFSSKTSPVQFASAPANVSADKMQANSKSGRALYLGKARLWQGDSVLEADSIELLRDNRMLKATGNIRGVFPQAAAPSFPNLSGTSASPKMKLWHVSADTLAYRDAESRAHLEKNVVVKSIDQTMRAPVVDLFFTRPASSGTNSASSASGPQQISRALGTGGAVVEQGARRATAESGEYTATEGKFVMSGGNPAIYDAGEGTTTGRQLTFFLADDTIIVDSESGSRTLTKHRVDK